MAKRRDYTVEYARRQELARALGFKSYGARRYAQEHPASKAAQEYISKNPGSPIAKLIRAIIAPEPESRAPPKIKEPAGIPYNTAEQGFRNRYQREKFWREAEKRLSDEAKDDQGRILLEVKTDIIRAAKLIHDANSTPGAMKHFYALKGQLQEVLGDQYHPIMRMLYGK